MFCCPCLSRHRGLSLAGSWWQHTVIFLMVTKTAPKSQKCPTFHWMEQKSQFKSQFQHFWGILKSVKGAVLISQFGHFSPKSAEPEEVPCWRVLPSQPVIVIPTKLFPASSNIFSIFIVISYQCNNVMIYQCNSISTWYHQNVSYIYQFSSLLNIELLI